jgi:probable rRNA maturation factor
MISVIIQKASITRNLPTKQQFITWVTTALTKSQRQGELLIRIVDREEMAKLNKQYRKKSGPTNVLAFPFKPMPLAPNDFLGDIVLCAPLIKAEAKAQQKKILSHWAHLTIHGVLHLLGYDHTTPKDAAIMERLETEYLDQLGFNDPYL